MAEGQQPMDMDNPPHEVAIMDASRIRLLGLDQQYNCCGTSADLYQFSYDPTGSWNKGNIFHANNMEDLSFDSMIEASDDTNKREAVFKVHEANERNKVENMMATSFSLKHIGILKTCVAGYNSQIGKVVSGFHVTAAVTLKDWLEASKKNAASTSIPPEVQDLIRTAYLAIMTFWKKGYTSDSLADACSYHMINNKIKIDPLCIRGSDEEDNEMLFLRTAFGIMISQHIKPVWNDDELDDFVDLLNNPRAGVLDVLGAPVLLSPASRELMYHKYGKAELHDRQKVWLQAHANPQAGWKKSARNADPILKKIIDRQAQRDKKKSVARRDKKKSAGFSTDVKGALHFASVVTAHYPQHFRNTAEGKAGVNMKARVDLLLKQVLPQLLSKRYNSSYT